MKINEIINSAMIKEDAVSTSQVPILLTQFKEISNMLVRECGPYLTEVGGVKNALFNTPLYRGVKGLDLSLKEPYETVTVNLNRSPKDIPLVLHKEIDAWFQKETGYKFRSTSLFTTGKMQTASEYGAVFVVIPKGDYHYCWSARYLDLWAEIEYYSHNNDENINHAVNITNQIIGYFDNNPNEMNNVLKIGDYQFDNKIAAGITSGHEIMFVCKEAILIDVNWLDLVRAYQSRAAERSL